MTENVQIKMSSNAVKPDIENTIIIKSPINITIHPHKRVIINTGLHIRIPKGYFGCLMSPNQVFIVNGIIESGNFDEIQVSIVNSSEQIWNIYLGDVICELIIIQSKLPQIEIIKDVMNVPGLIQYDESSPL